MGQRLNFTPHEMEIAELLARLRDANARRIFGDINRNAVMVGEIDRKLEGVLG